MHVVELSPGIHLRGVQRTLGLSFSTVRHHIERLDDEGIIERHRFGRYDRLFPKGFPASERDSVAIAHGKSSLLIMREFLKNNQVSNKRISETTGLAKSTVSKHVRSLLALGIVQKWVAPDGRKLLRSDEGSIARLLRFGETNLKSAVDNYVELWDM
jgi:predicted transcriptional regulator